MLIETERLRLRELTRDDLPAICAIMRDEETMYAYNGAYTEEEVAAWLDRQLARYAKYGFGLWAVELRESGEVIGQCGLTMQPWNGREVLEVGYLFNRRFWHRGYAMEAARACRDYAFSALGAEELHSIIRDTNIASQNVAMHNGMHIVEKWTKHFRGADMPHYLFRVTKAEYEAGLRGGTPLDRDGLMTLELSMWEALKNCDAAAFSRLVRPDAVMICGGLRCSGAGYAGFVPEFDCESYELTSFEVIYSTPELAQCHYIVRTTVKDVANIELAGLFHVTSTWRHDSLVWTLVFNMDSRIIEE